MYVFECFCDVMVFRYPMNSQMHGTSKNTSSGDETLSSGFSKTDHVQCLSQITPIAIGLSKFASVLKGVDALAHYSGGRVRRRFTPVSDPSVVHRLHHLRPLEHKGGTINSRVGLGRGWEKFNQGVTVDSPRRKFRV